MSSSEPYRAALEEEGGEEGAVSLASIVVHSPVVALYTTMKNPGTSHQHLKL